MQECFLHTWSQWLQKCGPVALNGWKQPSVHTPLLKRPWVMVISLPILTLCMSLSHPWLTETDQSGEGNWGRSACGWRHHVPWVRRTSKGSWYANQCVGAQVHQQWSGCSWDGKPGAGCGSCVGASPAQTSLQEGSPSPAKFFPQSSPGRHQAADAGVSGSSSDFFPLDSTEEGNEKQPPSWLRFALEGCFSPAALLRCCNTGNLLLLTPGVVSNSQMVLTSVSCNWWPTCLTL